MINFFCALLICIPFVQSQAECIGDNFLLKEKNELQTLDCIKIKLITGDLHIESNPMLAEMIFTNLTSIEGDLKILNNSALEKLLFPKLTSIRGTLLVKTNSALASIEFPILVSIHRKFEISSNQVLHVFHFPQLITSANWCIINDNKALEELYFPKWTTNGYAFWVVGNIALLKGIFPSLIFLRDSVSIERNNVLEELHFPVLTYIKGFLRVRWNPKLNLMNLPRLGLQRMPKNLAIAFNAGLMNVFNCHSNWVGKSRFPGGNKQNVAISCICPESPIAVQQLPGLVFSDGASPYQDYTTSDKAWDGKTETYYNSTQNTKAWTAAEFKTTLSISRIDYYPRNCSTCEPTGLVRMFGGRFEGSNQTDGSWTILYTIPQSAPELEWTSVCIAPSAPYRFLRYVSRNGAYGNIAEIRIWIPKPHTGYLGDDFLVKDQTELQILNYQEIEIITGELVFELNAVLTEFAFPKLTEILGNAKIENNYVLARMQFPALVYVHELVFESNPRLTETIFPNLIEIQSSLKIDNNAALKKLFFPKLTRISHSLIIRTNVALTTMTFAKLTAIGGILQIESNIVLPSFKFLNLKDIEGTLLVNINSALTSIQFPVLVYLRGQLQINKNQELKQLHFPKLIICPSWFIIHDNQALQQLYFPKLTSGYAFSILRNTALLEGTFSSLITIGNSVMIESNSALEELRFPALTKIGSVLRIRWNSNLNIMDFPLLGLLHLPSILTIYSNSASINVFNCHSDWLGKSKLFKQKVVVSCTIPTQTPSQVPTHVPQQQTPSQVPTHVPQQQTPSQPPTPTNTTLLVVETVTANLILEIPYPLSVTKEKAWEEVLKEALRINLNMHHLEFNGEIDIVIKQLSSSQGISSSHQKVYLRIKSAPMKINFASTNQLERDTLGDDVAAVLLPGGKDALLFLQLVNKIAMRKSLATTTIEVTEIDYLGFQEVISLSPTSFTTRPVSAVTPSFYRQDLHVFVLLLYFSVL